MTRAVLGILTTGVGANIKIMLSCKIKCDKG